MPQKIIVILGPTASGKSELAVKLAQKFNGEVISADSGQVYKGMDIGTGKITKKEMRNIPHHLLDIASPKTKFTVVQYRKLALRTINKILKQGKTPIICGGTGFYIQAVVDGIIIPKVKPDWPLRHRLNQLSIEELFKRLKKLDPKRARTIDKKNKRRLIRALEIVTKTKKPVPVLKKKPLPYPVLMVGVKKDNLKDRIVKRVEKMLKMGLEKEAKKFPEKDIIGYQEWREENPREAIITHTVQYTKRQITWFKRDKRIKWVKNYQEAEKLTRNFLNK